MTDAHVSFTGNPELRHTRAAAVGVVHAFGGHRVRPEGDRVLVGGRAVTVLRGELLTAGSPRG
jgi:hypothetical protein